MNYSSNEIIARYHRNCEIIKNNYQAHLKVYELGIISKVEEDFKENKIDNIDKYFDNLNKQYELFVNQINDDINYAIEEETNNFTKAFSSFLLLNQVEDNTFTTNSEMVNILKRIYSKKVDNTIKIGTPSTYNLVNNQSELDDIDIDAEILELINEIEGKL